MSDIKVEGIDYSPEGIMALRAAVISLRDDLMKDWPEGITETVMLTHVIAILSYTATMEATNGWQEESGGGRQK